MFSYKNVLFSNVYVFCQRILQLSRNSKRLELTSSSLQVKRNILLQKNFLINMRDSRTCWMKKDELAPGEKFLNNEVIDSDWLENFRMSKKNFEELVKILRPYLEKSLIIRKV